MKFEARLGLDIYEIRVERLSEVNGCQRFEVTLQAGEVERSCQVELLGRHRDRWTFKVDQAIEDFIISRTNHQSMVDWRNRLFPIEISDHRERSLSRAGSHVDHKEITQRAQMPGKIIRVLKGLGDTVEEGEGVVVVEAMKMQNQITSPQKGAILGCELKEGDSVSAGDVLFTIG